MEKIRLRDILIAMWISIFLMLLISGVSPNSVLQQDTVKQDTVKQDTIKKKEINVRQMSDLERKKSEYLDYQQRSHRINKSIETLNKQTMMMDSLLGKKDTTKIKK